ncbi:helix-turn-helix transcriptional regulator [Ruminococcus sp.]|uniref:helix-turn-helix domain-containing protein n=1 Tax=Ruminococcus sp. TaxID=41978 RepID=UPI001B5633B0|nr:helix-turn-helix transcriptional regulator [Ruminococcus sp.]MBP5433064.1 helix-turn-helix transcriptional regulator [Ruminococcus sp.]
MKETFNNIRAELARNKMTIEELADYLNIERKTFYNWELKGDFPARYIKPMAQCFKCTTDYLLGNENKGE